MCGYGEFVPGQRGLADLLARGLHASAGAPYRTRFWDPRPVLPVARNGAIAVVEWGGRGGPDLPQTGWARTETISANGRWLGHPVTPVTVPFVMGGEKGGEFDVDGPGLLGLLMAGPRSEERVFLVTTAASEPYRRATGHDRMPVAVDGTTLVYRGAFQPALF